jgi:hypothetical protein
LKNGRHKKTTRGKKKEKRDLSKKKHTHTHMKEEREGAM